MFTGINEVLQDSQTSGTALKIITLRIQGMKGALQDLGEEVDKDVDNISKVQGQILNLTKGKVNIFDDNGDFRNIYNILGEIQEARKTMSGSEWADLREILAGKNRANALEALMENWSQVEKATQTAYDSAGTAQKEQDKWMDSLKGHLNNLTVAWEKLSNDFLSSDFLKDLIDDLTSFVNLLDSVVEKFGAFPALATSLSGIFSFKNTNLFFTTMNKDIDGLTNKIGLFGKSFNDIKQGFSNNGIRGGISYLFSGNNGLTKQELSALTEFNKQLKDGTPTGQAWMNTIRGSRKEVKEMAVGVKTGTVNLEEFKNSTIAAKAGALGLQLTVTALNMALTLGLSFALQAAVTGIGKLIHAKQEAADKSKEAADEAQQESQKYQEQSDSLDELVKKYREFSTRKNDSSSRNEIKNIQSQIVDLVGKEADNLDLVNGKLDDELEKLLKIKHEQAEKTANKANNAYNKAKDAANKAIGENKVFGLDGYEYYGKVSKEEQKALGDNFKLFSKGNLGKNGLNFNNNVKEVTGINTDTIYEKIKFIEDCMNKLKSVEGYADSSLYLALQDSLEHYSSYVEKMDEQSQKLVSSILESNTSTPEFYKKEVDSAEAYEEYRNKLFDKLVNDDRIKEKINEGFLDKDKLEDSVNSYMATMNEFSTYYQNWNHKFGEESEKTKKLTKDQEKEISGIFAGSIDLKNLDKLGKPFEQYKKQLEEFRKLKIDPNQTVFGNIDLDNRQVLKWTDKTMNQYMDALQSWDKEAVKNWGKFSNDIKGSISTVFGASDSYNIDGKNFEIAFSPMLQTEHGAVLLSADEVRNHIERVIDAATVDGSWSMDEILKIDAQGIEGFEKNGFTIKGLIADIGDTAIQTGKAMHYLGNDGSLALSFKDIEKSAKEANMSTEDFIATFSKYAELQTWFDNLNDEDKKYVYQIGVEADDTSLWTLTKWQSELDYLRKGCLTTTDQMQKFEDIMNNTEEGNFSDYVENYTTKLSDLKNALVSIHSKELTQSDALNLAMDYPELAPYINDTDALADAIENLIDTSSQGMNDEIDNQIKEIGEDSPLAIEALEALREQLEKLSKTEWNFNFDKEVEKFDNLYGAMKESVSATGLTSKSINNIKDMFEGLEGYDPSKLFERTYNGIHLNTNELRKLQDQYEKTKKDEIITHLDDLKTRYNNLSKEIATCTDTEEKAQKMRELDGLQDKITEVADLASQYEGLTSSYNKWIQSQSSGEEGDMYDSIQNSYEDMLEKWEKGLVGQNVFREYTDLLSGKDLSTATKTEVREAFEALSETIEGTSYSARDFLAEGENGVLNFLNAVQQLNDEWVHLNDDNSWTINFGIGDDEKVAEQLGIDVEFVQSILRKLSDYEFDINLDSIFTGLDNMVRYSDEAYDKLLKLKEAGKIKWEVPEINLDVTKVQDAEEEIKKAQNFLDNFRKTDGKVDLEMEGAEEAEAVLVALINKKQELDKPAIMNVDTTNADSNIETTIALLQQFQTDYNNIDLQMAVGVDTQEVQQKTQETLRKLKEVPDEVKTSLGLNDDEFKKALDDLTKKDVDVKAGVKLNKDSLDVIKDRIKTLDDEALVKLGIDTKNVDSYNPENKNAKVEYDTNQKEIDKWQPQDKKANVNYTAHLLPFNVPVLNGVINYVSRFLGGQAQGTAHSQGTAFAKGTWGSKTSGLALGGELGQELIIRQGRFFTIGDDGAEFFNYKKDDIMKMVSVHSDMCEK